MVRHWPAKSVFVGSSPTLLSNTKDNLMSDMNNDQKHEVENNIIFVLRSLEMNGINVKDTMITPEGRDRLMEFIVPNEAICEEVIDTLHFEGRINDEERAQYMDVVKSEIKKYEILLRTN